MKVANEAEVLNTQEMIDDARERRSRAINGKSSIMECDQCEFKIMSNTLLKKHIETAHQAQKVEQTLEMRKRHQCDKCDYKTTSKAVLIRHTQSIHEEKESSSSKRKVCNICGKKFNKISTFNNHMKQEHENENGNAKYIIIVETK